MTHKNRELEDVVKKLSHSYLFPYSPAHMEEIATPNMNGKKDVTSLKNKLRFIKKLSKCYEYFPSQGKTIIKREDPKECYKRVTDQYHKNKNIECMEAELLQKFKDTDPEGSISSRVSNKGDSVLLEKKFDEELSNFLLHDKYLRRFYDDHITETVINNFKNNLNEQNHGIKERVLELAFNYLEYIRYKPEKIQKSRSRMHDCTHAIYATKSDFFVSDDKRFLAKIRAVYKYFSIETKVLNIDDFISTFIKKA